jgi:anti-anti-sigma factor
VRLTPEEDDRVVAMPAFRLDESQGSDGVARLTLAGELDLAVYEQLLTRVRLLLDRGIRVRIDLSALEFIDSRGMYALIRAVNLGREAGSALVEIDPKLTASVRNALELAGVTRMLWPPATRGGASATP